MPNWVYNSVTVNGSDDEVLSIAERLRRPHRLREGDTTPFNFMNVVEPGDGIEYDTAWYEWNCANWGTKWGAAEVSHLMTRGPEGNALAEYTFSTAWDAPRGVIDALGQLMLEVGATHTTVTWSFEEENGWGGEYEITALDGAFLVRSWDEPRSHADWVERGDVDGCPCEIGDPYDDCPVWGDTLALPSNGS